MYGYDETWTSKSAGTDTLTAAAAAAIECFDAAGAVVVPRTRFAPVKTCSDLFVLRSDAYEITPAATVEATLDKVRGHNCTAMVL